MIYVIIVMLIIALAGLWRIGYLLRDIKRDIADLKRDIEKK